MSEARQAKRQASEQTDKVAAKARHAARKPAAVRPAYVQAKMAVSQPNDASEVEADQVADEISRMPRGVSRQSDEEIQTASVDPGRDITDPDQTLTPRITRRISRSAIPPEEESLAPKLYRQGGEEEEAMQAKLHRATAEAEGEVQTTLQRQSGEEEEAVQTQIRRSATESEQCAQAKLHRATDESEGAMQAKLHCQESEDTVQTALYRQADAGEEEVQTQLARSTSDSDEPLQTALHRAAGDGEDTMQAALYRQADEGEEEVQAKLARSEAGADETVQASLHRATTETEDAVQTALHRQTDEGEEEVQTTLARSAAGAEETVQASLHRATAEAEGAVETKLRRATAPAEGQVQTKLHRATTEAEGAVQTALYREASEGEEELQTQLLRAPETTPDTVQTRLERAEQDASGAQTPGATEVNDETTQQIESMRGQGDPLPEAVLADMNEKFGYDFSAVRIHTDDRAAAMCAQVNARAFAVGDDLFFAPGEFAPDTEAGRRLLAHELTHVVQQSGQVSRRLQRAVEPAPDPAPTSGSDAAAKLADLSVLELPPVKHRHAALYTGAGARRAAGYKRNTSQSQVSVWNSGVQLNEDTIVAKLQRLNPDFVVPTNRNAQVPFKVGSTTLSTPWRSLRQRLLIPDWDRRGRMLTSRQDKFQVDHMVELQVFGDTTGNAGNVIGNLELLKGSPNASSGSAIRNSIYSKVTDFLAAQDPSFNSLSARTRATRRRSWLQTHTITFDQIRRAEGRAGDDADWWTRTEIEEAAPLDAVEPAPEQRLEGEPGTFVLASGPGGIEIGRYRYQNLQFAPSNNRLRNAMAGVRIDEIQLDSAVETGASGAPVGQIQATWQLPNGFRAGETVTIPLLGVGPYCASPGEIPALNTEFNHLSPVELPTIEMRDGALYAEGQINPSIPLLRDHPISITLAGNDLRFEVEFASAELSLPVPGLNIEEGSVSLFYSTEEGFGGSGSLDFGINRLGEGNLTIEASQRGGFSATGQFDFDSELFDRAQINIWYREGAFGGEGEIGIDNREKIRGIRSANLTVGFGENQFSATGEVQPDIPGVQQAGLTLAYSEEEGLTIGGNLQLSSDVPGIESGSIEVTVRKQDDNWSVSATGTAVPSIPGINSQLTVSYEDGAITAEAEAQYERGMLSGSLNVGATNRTLDSEGNPTGDPGDDIIVYGGGSLTIQIAPWLQGTAGVQFAPNGEITVTGEIGLPDQLEIFPRAEIDKSIFNIAIQAPIVPGIVAEVGGGLGAVAGIGPGVIDQLRLGIEYNPAHEENTHITGDAHLSIPADAGLRLSVRAGIGLGITGASATGGLEIGGTLGITGAAEAGVHIDWMPTTGLSIDANVSVHAQPSFTFDISGYVSVRALGFSVYDQTWELASFSFGSDYRFGISLPVHYREGEPFDVSLDDVEFEVPDIDTDQLLSGLIDRIA